MWSLIVITAISSIQIGNNTLKDCQHHYKIWADVDKNAYKVKSAYCVSATNTIVWIVKDGWPVPSLGTI